MSYWPRTRWESIPVSAPICAPSSSPETDRIGAAMRPAWSPRRSLSGASSGRIVWRFAAIQDGRSTSSSGGSSSRSGSPL